MANITVYNMKTSDIDQMNLDHGTYVINITQSHNSILGSPFYNRKDLTRAQRISEFQKWLEIEYKNKGRVFDLINALMTLFEKGYNIALFCVCAPKACHGDVIKYWIEQLAGGIL